MEKELSGSYPIVIDDRETGTINVAHEGLFWCFEATSELSADLVRLSVFGDEGEGYLGVMEPRDGKLRLKKRLSRSAVSAFPCPITHGGRQGAGHRIHIAAQPSGETVTQPIVIEDEDKPAELSSTECTNAPAAPAEEPEACLKDAETPCTAEPKASVPLVWRPCGCPCSYLSAMEAKQVFGSRSGVLEASDGEFIYLALPEDAELTAEQVRLFPGVSTILGKRHLVCRVKDGNLV